MKAIIIQKYGPAEALQLAELETPAFKPNQVLVKNYYTCINPMDTKVRAGQFKLFAGRKFPKILGSESAGVVEQVGDQVTHIKEGDRVMADLGFKFGTYAQFTAVAETSVYKLPDNVTFTQGTTLPCAACTAYNCLYGLGKIKPGDKVLIYGAYGGVGSFAVQLARLAGATVTAVSSTGNINHIKALGANSIIDYTRQDVYATEGKFDMVLDAVGKLDILKVRNLLKQGGIMVTTVASFKQMLLATLFNLFGSKKFKTVWNRTSVEKMNILANLVADNKLKVIVDREYALEDLPEAHRYSETGKAKGKILIKI